MRGCEASTQALKASTAAGHNQQAALPNPSNVPPNLSRSTELAITGRSRPPDALRRLGGPLGLHYEIDAWPQACVKATLQEGCRHTMFLRRPAMTRLAKNRASCGFVSTAATSTHIGAHIATRPSAPSDCSAATVATSLAIKRRE